MSMSVWIGGGKIRSVSKTQLYYVQIILCAQHFPQFIPTLRQWTAHSFQVRSLNGNAILDAWGQREDGCPNKTLILTMGCANNVSTVRHHIKTMECALFSGP